MATTELANSVFGGDYVVDPAAGRAPAAEGALLAGLSLAPGEYVLNVFAVWKGRGDISFGFYIRVQ